VRKVFRPLRQDIPPPGLGLAPAEVRAKSFGLARLPFGLCLCRGGREARFGFQGLGHLGGLRRCGRAVNDDGVAPDREAAYEAAARIGTLL
jgi:hypothetical protein